MKKADPPRGYIRHTVNVPLEVRAVPDAAPATQQGINVSHGGLAFNAAECLAVNDVIQLRIPTVHPPFEAQARVAWCRPDGDRYLIGVEFLDADDAFRSRMVQQVCAVENYRQEVRLREGRDLDSQQAAAEWIRKYADRFPSGGTPA